MTDSMISRCHCQITAILAQKRKNGPAGGPISLLKMVVCHHLPFLGHKLGDHQRARDSLQGPSLEDACDLRGLSRYGGGPLDATTRASTPALLWPSASSSLVPVAYLSLIYEPRVQARPKSASCVRQQRHRALTMSWKGAEVSKRPTDVLWWKALPEPGMRERRCDKVCAPWLAKWCRWCDHCTNPAHRMAGLYRGERRWAQ